MSISITCAACGKQYVVNDALAGKKVRCKACGATVLVAASAAPPASATERTRAPLGAPKPKTAAAPVKAAVQKAKPAPRAAPPPAASEDAIDDLDSLTTLEDESPISTPEDMPDQQSLYRRP